MSRSVARWLTVWCSWLRRSVSVGGGGVVDGRGAWEGGVIREAVFGGVGLEGVESGEDEDEDDDEEGDDSTSRPSLDSFSAGRNKQN